MWEGWREHGDLDDVICYELMVGSKVQVLLSVCLSKIESEPLPWEAHINAFNPSVGEYVIFEGRFSSFEEAEAKAWEEAQAAVRIRND